MGTASFTKQDKRRLASKGISSSQAAEQMTRFKKGFSHAELIRPCTVGEGIIRLSAKEQKRAEQIFLKNAPHKKLLKFVPASGAASRMFHFLEDTQPEQKSLKQKFLNHLADFAFYSQLAGALKKEGQDIIKLKQNKNLQAIVRALLEKEGLGYRQAPKGMILFHRDSKGVHTAFEEHLREGIIFESAGKKINIHFTLPVSARKEVRQHLKVVATKTRKKFILSDSVQSEATDCLAVEKNGAPVRDEKGEVLLRPAGHGALLTNLNQIKADLIYVKNIDNILPQPHRGEAERWKRVLSGAFFVVQSQVFDAQKILAKKKMTPQEAVQTLKLAGELGWKAPSKNGRKSLISFFYRPLRVCGMVPNTGEPGGGPFWIRGADGSISAQIIESAEVNFTDAAQARIWKSSTHFNPVDFVCGTTDWRGKKYNLMQFSDKERGLISKKSYQGREIRAMELPGLWNGGMANWISLFVEIPASVFAPVKTVLDLLRPEHQPKKGR